jgi:succinate dehydrogenase / fumarate reductase, cytochrome b subunit
MAGTGVVLFGFVCGHLIGNLQFFIPDHGEAINRYGHFLQSLKELLWPIRLTLLTLVGLHIWSATRLTLENRAARPVDYTTWNPTAASYASRTMFLGGLIIAAFVVFHILHYTVLANVGGADLGNLKNFETHLADGTQVHDIFKMLVYGFNVKAVAIFYIIAVGLLAFHLSHGVEALFQSLGLRSRGYIASVKCFAAAISVFLFVGYASLPVSVLLGYGKEVLK